MSQELKKVTDTNITHDNSLTPGIKNGSSSSGIISNSQTNNSSQINSSNSSNQSSWRDAYMNAINNYGQNQSDYLKQLYSDLKNGSYKQLLNNRIAASIAKEQALKAGNNALKANGYGSQGMAESNFARMNNAYINALGSANSSYNDEISDYNQQYASQMSDIEQNKDQYLLNYYKSLADEENTATNNSFDDFIDTLTTLTSDDEKAKFITDRITTDNSGNLYLDGRKLSNAEATRYKNAMYNIDESSNDTTTDENAITNSDSSMSYVPNGEMSIFKANNYLQEVFDTNGNRMYSNSWDFGNSFDAFGDLMKSSNISNGTLVKLVGKGGRYMIGVWNNGKLYYVKDSQKKRNETSDDNKLVVDDYKKITRGKKT